MNRFQVKCHFSLMRTVFACFLSLGMPMICVAQDSATQPDAAKTDASAGAGSSKAALLFAEQFNVSGRNTDLKNGGKLGSIGSGVSERPKDLAYVNDVFDTDKEQTPVALLKKAYPVDGLEEITVVMWYKPAEDQGNIVTLFDMGSLQLIGDRKKGWVLRVEPKGKPSDGQYWFNLGVGGTYSSWFTANEWTFIAVTWKKSTSEVCAYQGVKIGGVRNAGHVTRPVPEGGLVERKDRDKHPDAIGNTAGEKYDRPFRGAIDNVRVYSKVLTEDALEQIRKADIRGEEPPRF
ncbi:TPA: hypothetical protein DDW35_11290 [Candidatus Sumerlaeota bacterium]|jgi:hypothetical protein|nr:hypothetical protein [Candidatus Sumerlaeota bacterium]